MNRLRTTAAVRHWTLRLRKHLILLAIAWLACLPAVAAQRVWGYVAWWMADEWRHPGIDRFERLIFMQTQVGPEGDIVDRHGWPDQWRDLQDRSRDAGVGLEVGLTLFEPQVFNRVFSSPARVQRLLTETLALAASASGVHLDIEVHQGLQPVAVAGYRGFVERLAQHLASRSPAKTLSLFLPFGDYLKIYDARTVAQADHVVLQGYDAHYLDSPVAGPVSPLAGMDTVNWEKMLAAADQLKLPRARMVMGFPLYGYEWTVPSCTPRGQHVGVGEITTLLPLRVPGQPGLKHNVRDRVQRYGARVEPVSQSLYYQFTGSDGVCRVGWFEDAWSLGVRAQWVQGQNLGGIAFFPLGYDRGELVNTLLARWPRSTGQPDGRR